MPHLYENIEGWFTYAALYDEMVARFPHGQFVEIGCWKGRSGTYLLEKIKESGGTAHCYFIDPFTGSSEHVEMLRGKPQDYLYETFFSNVSLVGIPFSVYREYSVEAAKSFPDNSLDFVYIDGDHDGDASYNDMRAWYPKVKPGGVLAGHDIVHPPIRNCVERFSSENNLAWQCFYPPLDYWKFEKPLEIVTPN